MDPKRLQIIKSEEVVVGKRPGYLIFWRATNPDQYKSVISGKIYVIVNEKNTVSIGSYMVNTEYDEMMVKGLLSTFRFK